ncbi:MAG: PDZ domain-containing protein [Actinomycetota bacterium]|nr:PDZ domain-containing protein [Actinomycetota bacterium]
MQQNDWGLPAPPDVPSVSGFAPWRVVIAAGISAALVVAAAVIPIPVFFRYLPGPVRDVQKLVQVEQAKTYSSEGQLFLTTVSVDTSVTFFEIVETALDPTKDLVMKEEVTGGQSLETVRDQQIEAMRRSKQAARQIALSAVGIPAGAGARVLSTVEGAPADGLFEEGDRVVAVDGTEVTTACDVIEAVNERRAGDTLRIDVVREGRRRALTVTAADHPAQPGAAFVGIEMADVKGSSVGVKFRTGDIAGPSAGLMFSLALYDRLTPDDLTHGRKIAGTGEIACGGAVGPIGGIEEKVAGAERAGAEIFLAPALNFADAQTAAGDIEVISVSTFQEAVDYLEAL